MYFCFENLKQTEILFSAEMDGLLFFYENHYRKIDKKSVCVAVSGGADSLSLLFLMNTWARKNNWEIFCITVDHKLRKESLDEALYVKKICEDLEIHHETLTWNHTDIKDEGKLENLARDARYDLIKKFCEEKNIDFVATGHNWNDQMETYELRKNSGSSKIGLAGMNQIKTLSENLKLIRPILHFSKKYLEDFLIKKNVSWKIDPMNFDDNFKRVSVRKKINSYDFEKIKLISKKIINYEIQRYEIEKNSVDFLKKYCEISDFGFAKVDKKFFLHQKGEIQTEILKRLIWNIGMKKYPTKIDSKILSDILNKKINTLGKCFIKIRKENIFILNLHLFGTIVF